MGKRFLVIMADDFGIGPATSQGILELGREGAVTSTVLLVNSPHAESAVRAWRQAGAPLEVGWHPCLTLDRPVLPAWLVPSLVDHDGRFFSLGGLLRRLALGRIRPTEVAAELRAQWQRFVACVGKPPTVVNGHHHLHTFPLVGRVLRKLLAEQSPAPYLRRVREPWKALTGITGARCKRAFLHILGAGAARQQRLAGFPGNDWLVGLGSPAPLGGPERLLRWLNETPGEVVELTCHPGYPDETLPGRDQVRREELDHRLVELQMFRDPAFRQDCLRAGFTLAAPTEVAFHSLGRTAHAA
jgi:predicted glycoside hydrolase/deacetylase ChbG (UPF0249 family)